MDKKNLFKEFRLYAVTDLSAGSAQEIQQVEDACRGGADIIQLRAKRLPDLKILELGAMMKAICQHYGKLFFVNDRVDLALALEADGVHLGQEDMPLAQARRLSQLAGHRLWLGKSTHSLEQAKKAEAEGADYIGVGPVFGTPTKPDYPPVGLGLITEASACVKIPLVAIGGIDAGNIDQVLRAGARRIAVVRALFSGQDITGSARNLKGALIHHG